MITSWLLARALDWRTYAAIALLACLGTIAYKIDKHGYNNGVAQANKTIAALNAQISADHDLYAQSILDSSKIQTEWQAKIDKANEDAHNAQIKLETASRDNQRIIDSLRVTTSKASERAKMPTTPKDAIIDYTETLTDVFKDCTIKYADLAKQADSESIDKQAMIDSYPQSK